MIPRNPLTDNQVDGVPSAGLVGGASDAGADAGERCLSLVWGGGGSAILRTLIYLMRQTEAVFLDKGTLNQYA